MIRQDFGSDDTCFRVVKIALLVIHIMTLLGAVIMLFVVSVMVSASMDQEADEEQRASISKNIFYQDILVKICLSLNPITKSHYAKQG